MTTETPTAADAAQALDQIAVWQRGLDAAATLTRFALGQMQVQRELDAAILQKRADLEAAGAGIIDEAKASAERQAADFISEAKATASRIIADGQSAADSIAALVASKQAELDSLNVKLAETRAAARALAGD
jgi:regulator of protease activity HflC (stomatin/prohibitin superfamily)